MSANCKSNLFFLLFLYFLIAWGCKKNNPPEPPRDPSVQIITDQKDLKDYLKTHFYNYEDFQEDPQNFDLTIKIDTIMGDNSNKIPLIEQVQSKKVKFRHNDNQVIDYDYYYLITRKGNGQSPHIADSAYVAYRGQLLNRSQFDLRQTPIWLDLTSVIKGFKEGISLLNTGDFKVNEDNTIDFFDYGQGLFFFPSGLGYFSNPSGGIPEYSPLVFEVSLYTSKQTDHDGDGILSRDEYDKDGDGIPDDSDQDGTPDYLDKT